MDLSLVSPARLGEGAVIVPAPGLFAQAVSLEGTAAPLRLSPLPKSDRVSSSCPPHSHQTAGREHGRRLMHIFLISDNSDSSGNVSRGKNRDPESECRLAMVYNGRRLWG